MFEETPVKIYRLVTLAAAVLITLLLTLVFTREKVGEPQKQTHVAVTTDAAADTRSAGV
jgi:hypothetical protein